MTDARASSLAVFRLINEILSNELELERSLGAILRFASEMIGATKSSVMLADMPRQHLIVKAVHGHPESMIGEKLAVGASIAGVVFSENKEVVITDIESNPRFRRANDPRYELRHLMSLPMVLDGEPIGVMNFNDNGRGGPFTDADLATMRELIDHVIFAVEKAIEEEEETQMVSDLLDEIMAHYQMADLAGIGEPETIPERTLATALDTTGSRRGCVCVRRGDRSLEVAATRGARLDATANLWETGIIGWVARNKATVTIFDIAQDTRFTPEEVLPFERSYYICVPIATRNKLYGTLSVWNKDADRIHYPYFRQIFTDGDMRLLESVGRHAALALESDEAFRRAIETKKLRLESEIARRRVIELEEMNRKIQEAQSALIVSERKAILGKLAAGVAHEIRNPLAGIQLSFENLLEERSFDSEVAHECIRDVRAMIKRASRIITELLQFSGARTRMKPGLDVRAVLRESRRLVGLDAEGCGVKVVEDFDSGLPAIEGDGDQLIQVASNVLRNAVEAVEGKGTIHLEAGREGDQVWFAVTDSGPGIGPEEMRFLFDAFYSTKKEGTGLGLSICQAIVEAHGGAITADNSPRRGARFRIRLPIAQPAAMRAVGPQGGEPEDGRREA